MIVLFNTNEYLGGGETLLLRIGEYLAEKTEIAVITSTNSYISKNIKFNCKLLEVNSYDYYYMNINERTNYLEEIKYFLNDCSNLKIITFCFRELYVSVDLSKMLNITPFHLLLHPLDHLYVSQSLTDKIKQNYIGKQRFSKLDILKINKKIIESLNEKGLLISMNDNISDRVEYDFDLVPKHTIALPVFDDSLKLNVRKKSNKNIVWVGRLVDFKLPAIFAMIDFLDQNIDYTFNIIGYGEEERVRKYINKKNNKKINSQVKYLGKIDHSILKNKIKEFDVGYAMGTSIIELSSMGLPVIIATASPDFKIFNDELCSGMSYELGYGNVGDDLYNPNLILKNLVKISDCIKKIEDNYEKEAQLSFNKTKDVFSIEKNTKNYQELFLNTTANENIFINIKIPNPDFLKKLVLRIKND